MIVSVDSLHLNGLKSFGGSGMVMKDGVERTMRAV